MQLPRPKYICQEESLHSGKLQDALFGDTRQVYLLPAEMSGLDGAYCGVGYLGKTSFTVKSKKGGYFIGSRDREDNMKYTALDNWLGSIKHCESTLSSLKKSNVSTPLLLLCAELPFYGPAKVDLPKPEMRAGNCIEHLDLSSRLCCYMLGRNAVELFYRMLPA